MRYALILAAAVGAGCATTPAARVEAPPSEQTPRAEATPLRLPFIENDLALALSRAKAENKPLFVDAWAPW